MAKVGKNEENKVVIIPENDEELSSIHEKMAAPGPLEDDELENVSGGIQIVVDREDHWYGNTYFYRVCGTCGGKDFDLDRVIDASKISVICKKCRRWESVDLSGLAW